MPLLLAVVLVPIGAVLAVGALVTFALPRLLPWFLDIRASRAGVIVGRVLLAPRWSRPCPRSSAPWSRSGNVERRHPSTDHRSATLLRTPQPGLGWITLPAATSRVDTRRSARARREPHPNRSRRARRARDGARLRRRARCHDGPRGVREHHHGALRGVDARVVDLHRRDHRGRALGHAERRRARPGRGQRRRAHPAAEPRRRERAHRRGRRQLHEHRRGPAPLRRPRRRRGVPVHPVRGARLAPHVRGVRAARPEGLVHASRSRLPRTGRSSRTPPRPSRSTLHDHGAKTWAFAPTPRISSYITALVAGPYHVVRDELTSADGRAIPLGVFSRKSLVAVPRRRLHLREDEAGLRVLRGEVRRAVPVREVRPALRARVQRGRHGERGRGDVHRVLRVPLEGHGCRARAPRRHDPARARPHVVRRPRHDEVVERPVAERVVRRVGVDDRDRRGHRVDRGVDDLQLDGEELGLPPGPAARRPIRSSRRSTTSKTCW